MQQQSSLFPFPVVENMTRGGRRPSTSTLSPEERAALKKAWNTASRRASRARQAETTQVRRLAHASIWGPLTGTTCPLPRPPPSTSSLFTGSQPEPAHVAEDPSLRCGDDYVDIFGNDSDELERIVVRSAHRDVAQVSGAELLWASSLAVGGPSCTTQVALSMGGRGFEVFRTGVTVSTMARTAGVLK